MDKPAAATPLVSVICLCYNHAPYVEETLNSVWTQTYQHLEVIIVDDASRDESVKVIRNFLEDHPAPFPVKTLFMEKNLGNCRAFNQAWKMAEGEFIIDLATDDVMLPERVAQQLACFASLPPEYGVVFTESRYIDATGKPLYDHYAQRYRHIRPIPEGDVYKDVLARYFISSPTVMVKQEVLKQLGGYDEQLAYEDFDFWLRAARHYKFAYLNQCTTLVRKLNSSMSAAAYRVGDRQLLSTYKICQKARRLNRSPAEEEALLLRVRYELRQAVLSGNFDEADLFFRMLDEMEGLHGLYRLLRIIQRLRINLSWFRILYLKIRY
ncbi:MAG: glycosyltransferase [Cyclobacteriaceae bacterium]